MAVRMPTPEGESGDMMTVKFVRSVCIGDGIDVEKDEVRTLHVKKARWAIASGHAVPQEHPEVQRQEAVVTREPKRGKGSK